MAERSAYAKTVRVVGDPVHVKLQNGIFSGVITRIFVDGIQQRMFDEKYKDVYKGRMHYEIKLDGSSYPVAVPPSKITTKPR